ncbi:hypothetical protein NTGHW29_330006 [Candidatus Nitrotoga sp. HW29]|nr:hypothetical protein NTGHW29_330006 [Candidatus Nitrotoga sp. HW29]
MAFAQLTYRESLRDIEACLRGHADFAQSLINLACSLYVDEPFGIDFSETVYALDATTIDLRGNTSSFIHACDQLGTL